MGMCGHISIPANLNLMRNILYIGLPILLLCLVSCNPNKFYSPDEISEVEYPEFPDSISGDIADFNLSNDIFSVISYNDLVVFFSYSDPLIHVVNTRDDSIIAEFGNIGHSKVEFEDVPYKCYFRSNNHGDLIMCFQELQKTKMINLSSTILKSKCVLERNVKNRHSDIDFSTFWISDSVRVEYKRYGYDGDARDNVKSASSINIWEGEVCKSYSMYPSLLSSKNGVDENIYMAAFDVSPDMTKCVEIPLFQDCFTIFDMEKKQSIGVKSKKEDHNLYERLTRQTSNEAQQELKLQTINYCLSDSYIFIWHNGKISITEQNAEERIQNNPEIRILDWNGNFIKSLILKGKLRCIAYNEMVNAMYAIDYNGKVVLYDLSKILK